MSLNSSKSKIFTLTTSGTFVSTASQTYTFTTDILLSRIIPNEYIHKKFLIKTSFYTSANTVLLNGINLFLDASSSTNLNTINNGTTYLGTAVNYLRAFDTNTYTYILDKINSNDCIIQNNNFFNTPLEIIMTNLGGVNFTITSTFILTLSFQVIE